jgi:uncharacterized protein YkwD
MFARSGSLSPASHATIDRMPTTNPRINAARIAVVIAFLSLFSVVVPVGSSGRATHADAAVVRTVVVQGVRIRAIDASMITMINNYRAAHGLRRLPSQARRWSIHMATIRALRHDPYLTASARRGGCSASRVGEIIANRSGGSVSSRSIFAMYLSSRQHRALILSRSFRFLGISTVDTATRGGRSYWDVVKFAYAC